MNGKIGVCVGKIEDYRIGLEVEGKIFAIKPDSLKVIEEKNK